MLAMLKSTVHRVQVSFEIIMVAGVIIVVSMAIISNFTDIRPSTTALVIAKADTLEKLNSLDDYYYITTIDYVETVVGGIDIDIFTEPADDLSSLDFSNTASQIVTDAGYSPVDISINGVSVGSAS